MTLTNHQDIEFGVADQVLVFDAPEGRPSSVTSVTVYLATAGDDGTTEAATTGSPSVEADPDGEFSGACGFGRADARICTLLAAGVEVGRTYLATNAGGEREWVEVVSVTADGDEIAVQARNPLANAYDAEDTFVTTRISVAIDDAWAADSSNLSPGIDPRPYYRARWVYVVDGITYVHDSYFDLVRYRGRHTVTPPQLDAMYPGYADRLPTFHQEDNGQRLVDEAYEQVRWDLQAGDVNDAAVRDRDAINRAVMLRFGVVLAEAMDPDRVELRERRYREFFDRIFRVTQKVAVDTDESGAGESRPAQRLFEK